MGVLGLGSVDAFTLMGLIVSVGGAALLIAIVKVLTR